ncbi:hypothetical protein CYY_008391 [Polysphondylium violaceum]|uniref:EGF-like domain-containing protein n=1 Tax=Polysphondylium violaceum TaxID=133409 RepID=A0A8J4PLP7_9MYCE|nr:hypothetical protein CYY_008391 [Polysphondylium violaceum]
MVLDLIVMKEDLDPDISSIKFNDMDFTTTIPTLVQEPYYYYRDLKTDLLFQGLQMLYVEVNGVKISNHSIACVDPIANLVFNYPAQDVIRPSSNSKKYFKLPNITHTILPTTFYTSTSRGPYDYQVKQDPIFQEILFFDFNLVYNRIKSIDIDFTLSWGTSSTKTFNYKSFLDYYTGNTYSFTPNLIQTDKGDFYRPVLYCQVPTPNYRNLTFTLLETDYVAFPVTSSIESTDFIMIPYQNQETSTFVAYDSAGSLSVEAITKTTKINPIPNLSTIISVNLEDKIYPFLKVYAVTTLYDIVQPPSLDYLHYAKYSWHDVPQFIHPLYSLVSGSPVSKFSYFFYKRFPPYFTIQKNLVNTSVMYITELTYISIIVTHNVTDIINLHNGKGQAILSIDISDDYSGFCNLNYNQLFTINSANIVSGDLKAGKFQKIIYISDLFPPTLTIEDHAANSVVYENIYNFKSNKIDKSFNKLFNAFDISLFYFENKNVNLTSNGYLNTLYLNFTTAGPDTTIFFTCKVFSEPINYRDYPFYYNETLGLYSIPFYLPAKMATRDYLNYSIWISSYEINYEAIEAKVGKNSTLSVFNDLQGDEMPPIITNIQFIGNPTTITYDQTLTTPTKIGWVLTIVDSSGLESANFTVTSQLDPIGYNFTLTPNDKIAGTSLSGDYEIPLIFSPSNCTASQVFKISYASLRDVNGRLSQLNARESTTKVRVILNPFYKFVEFNTDVTLTCTSVPTNTISSSFQNLILKQDYDTAKKKLYIAFDIVMEAPLLKNKPLLMLESFIGKEIQMYECESFVMTNNENIYSYNFTCTPPYGFGYPNHIFANPFGIFNRYYYIIGSRFPTTIFVNFTREISLESGTITPSKSNLLKLYGNNLIDLDISICSFDLIFPNRSQHLDYIPPSYFIYQPLALSFLAPAYIRTDFLIIVKSPMGISQEINIIYSGDPYFPSSSESQSISSSSLDQSLSDSSSKGLPCPGNPICGGKEKGTCQYNRCICQSPYTGLDCTSIIIPIDYNPNTTNPNTNITIDIPTSNGEKKDIKLSSLIQVVSLLELDSNQNILQEFIFKEWVFTNITTTVPQYLYETTILHNNHTTYINVTVSFFEYQQFIVFAQQNITMNSNSLKYQVSMSSYEFQSKLNYLQLVMQTNFTSGEEESSCSYTEFVDFENDKEEYLLMQINGNSFNGRFIKTAIIDDRVTTISNTLLDSKYNIVNSDKTTSSFIGINIPIYSKQALIDPDFSLVISIDSAKDKKGSICSSSAKSKLSGAQIAGIVIGVVVITTSAVVVSVYLIYKNIQKKKNIKSMEMKMKQLN